VADASGWQRRMEEGRQQTTMSGHARAATSEAGRARAVATHRGGRMAEDGGVWRRAATVSQEGRQQHVEESDDEWL
jgi:hypothetical protein